MIGFIRWIATEFQHLGDVRLSIFAGFEWPFA